MSLVPAAAPGMGEACGSELSADDIGVIHQHSRTIGQAVKQTSEAIQKFLDWMNTKQRPAQWFREVAIEFNNGLRQSLEGKNKKHIQNVERTVWRARMDFFGFKHNTQRDKKSEKSHPRNGRISKQQARQRY